MLMSKWLCILVLHVLAGGTPSAPLFPRSTHGAGARVGLPRTVPVFLVLRTRQFHVAICLRSTFLPRFVKDLNLFCLSGAKDIAWHLVVVQ